MGYADKQMAYNQKLRDMAAARNSAMGPQSVVDVSGPIGEGVGASNLTQNDSLESGEESSKGGDAGAAMAKAAIDSTNDSGSAGTKALDIGAMGAMAAGGPVGIGIGLGAAAASAALKANQAKKNAKYAAEVQKFNARQAAYQHLAQVGQNLKA